jgi:hypothetical protein
VWHGAALGGWQWHSGSGSGTVAVDTVAVVNTVAVAQWFLNGVNRSSIEGVMVCKGSGSGSSDCGSGSGTVAVWQ